MPIASLTQHLEQAAPLLNPITASLFEEFVMVGCCSRIPTIIPISCTAAPLGLHQAVSDVQSSISKPISTSRSVSPTSRRRQGFPGRTL
jgi:hypothetical protein